MTIQPLAFSLNAAWNEPFYRTFIATVPQAEATTIGGKAFQLFRQKFVKCKVTQKGQCKNKNKKGFEEKIWREMLI